MLYRKQLDSFQFSSKRPGWVVLQTAAIQLCSHQKKHRPLQLTQLEVGNTANFGIDPIPSNYRASIANTNTFYLKIPDH